MALLHDDITIVIVLLLLLLFDRVHASSCEASIVTV